MSRSPLLPARTLLVLGAFASGLAADCGRSEPLRARIVDEAGRPIAGSILYVEAVGSQGAYDFAFSEAGPDGNVPPAGKTLELRLRSGAKLALVALAPGKKATVVYDQAGRVQADGIEFVLVALPAVGSRWEPDLAQLTYPFDQDPSLFRRVGSPESAPLREAFRAAFEPIASGSESVTSNREEEKLLALRRLDSLVAGSRVQ